MTINSRRSLVFLAACLAALATDGFAAPADSDLFARIDKSGDGFITSREIDNSKQRLFERLVRTGDKNGDGRLDRAEFAQGLSPAPPPARQAAGSPPRGAQALQAMFARRDRDGDGKLSREEAPPRLLERFDRLDANADGSIDREELARIFPARP
jgi:Ca2+-binding EF-hand superfamily protein